MCNLPFFHNLFNSTVSQRRQPMKIKTNTKNKKEKIILYGRNKQNLYNQN